MTSTRQSEVGVVVIGRDEGKHLRWCLESAVARAATVVYVDCGSTDDSVEVALEHDVDVVELDPTTGITPARARNEGIARLREVDDAIELVQVIDGNSELMPGWLEEAAEALRDAEDVAVVCGRRWERYPRLSVYNKLCDLEWDTPVGETKAYTGDAVIRLLAFDKVGGYNGSLLVGEDAELCLRLRRAGWRVLRVDHDMTVHDAQMTTFGQWWQRAVCKGYAFAEGRFLHQATRREVRSALIWGLVLPIIMLVAAWPTAGLSFLMLGAYGWLFRKLRGERLRHGDLAEDATLFAQYAMVAKSAQVLGVLGYWMNRLLRRRVGVVQYMGPDRDVEAPRQTPKPTPKPSVAVADYRVLYVGDVLPGRSQTFTYREVMGLRRCGLPVLVASVQEPERRHGDPGVDALAEEAVEVYGLGPRRVITDAARAIVRRPRPALRTLGRGLADALIGADVPMLERPKVIWHLLAGLALGHRVRDLGIDHLHAHQAHVPTTIAMYAATSLETPFSFTGHAVDLFSRRTLLRQKLRRAAFVPCPTEWHRLFYQRIVRRSDHDLPVVRCGVDVDEFRTGRSEERERGEPCRLLSVGRLVPRKGLDVLLDALGALTRDDVPFQCRIIGDGPEMAALRRQRIELGVSLQVELLGSRTNEHVKQAMEWADVFVLPCRVDDKGERDGIPVAVVEAMAAGVPVVGGDLVTLRELIEHETSGMLVRPGSVEDLATALRTLIEQPERRDALAKTARERIEAEFALTLNIERLHGMFLQMAGVVPDRPADASVPEREPEQQAA